MKSRSSVDSSAIALTNTVAWGGWWSGAKWVPSPHWDQRPSGMTVELFVIHNISLPPGQFGGTAIDALFLGCLDPHAHAYFQEIAGLRVSAHFVIRRTGELVQFVGTDRRAWHAGASSWNGRGACNDFSLGIELEGVDDRPYEPVQYTQLIQLIRRLRGRYPVPLGHIVGHEHIAPHRKTDPGPAFDWAFLRATLEE